MQINIIKVVQYQKYQIFFLYNFREVCNVQDCKQKKP